MFKCGQCRQFTRARDNEKDLCEAWQQPTLATREACGYFMPKQPLFNLSDYQQLKKVIKLIGYRYSPV